jgi:hypothetical protein
MQTTTVQENLFETTGPRQMRRRVKELDMLISRAMKQDRYDQARELTQQQADIIRKLVEIGEGGTQD